ncbi:MAG: outer membrane beta-barrel protein [Alloprevotella sp.]|nr:outer membrane beta-barrel protein [Alloprevotella sp.]MBR1446697.1 outer membrane beta-barrel protein [Alloprevotella sp.]
MKKAILTLLVALIATAANAQFEKGTKYVGASFSNFGLSYSKKSKFSIGVNAEAGYCFADSWMLRANVGYTYQKNAANDFTAGAGVRYYILQNGLFLGAGVEYKHQRPNFNDLLIPVEIGYTFYLNHYLAIEPSVYFKMSTNDFGDGSTVGLRLGLGYYFK